MSDRAITGLKVRVRKIPPGCCGVLRLGHENKVAKRIHVPGLFHLGDILILEDGTLVWSKEVEIIEGE